jgi:hypothetical protein
VKESHSLLTGRDKLAAASAGTPVVPGRCGEAVTFARTATRPRFPPHAALASRPPDVRRLFGLAEEMRGQELREAKAARFRRLPRAAAGTSRHAFQVAARHARRHCKALAAIVVAGEARRGRDARGAPSTVVIASETQSRIRAGKRLGAVIITASRAHEIRPTGADSKRALPAIKAERRLSENGGDQHQRCDECLPSHASARSAGARKRCQEKGVRNRFPADGLQVDTSITENGS